MNDWLRNLTQGQLVGLIALAIFALIGFSAIIMQLDGPVSGSRVSTVGQCYDEMKPEVNQILTDRDHHREVLYTAVEIKEDGGELDPDFRALVQTAFYISDEPNVSEFDAMRTLWRECEYHFGSL